MMKSGNEQVLNDTWNDAWRLYRSELDKRIANDSCSDLTLVSSGLYPVCLKLSNLLMSRLHASTPENHISTYSEWLNNACTKGEDMYVSTMEFLCENQSNTDDSFNAQILRNWEKVQFTIISALSKVYMNLETDTNLEIHNLTLLPQNGENYYIRLTHIRDKFIHMGISNCTLKGIHFYMDNTLESLSMSNSVYDGGRISVDSNLHQELQKVAIGSCSFHGNIDHSILNITNASNITIVGSNFTDLHATGDVDIVSISQSNITMYETSFRKCTLANGQTLTHSIVKLSNSIISIVASRFEDNNAMAVSYGMILLISSSKFEIKACSYVRNLASSAVVSLYPDSSGTLSNVTFDSNIGDGSCLHTGVDSNVTISHLEFTNSSRFRHVIRCGYSTMFMTNAIISNNSAPMMDIQDSNAIIVSSMFFNNAFRFEGDSDVGVRSSNVTITNSTFKYNTGTGKAKVLRFTNSDVLVIGSEFLYNSASESGGVFQAYKWSSYVGTISSSLRAIDCVFQGNQAKNGGGVIFNEDDSAWRTTSFENCTFKDNHATEGAVASLTGSTITFQNCQMNNNSASGNGGVLSSRESNVTMSNCSVTNNRAGRFGGVISWTYHGAAFIADTVFQNNTCRIEGGVIKTFKNISIEATRSIFSSNTAEGAEGGAISLETDCSLISTDCRFSSNSAATEGGAVLVADHSFFQETRSVFDNNTVSDMGEQHCSLQSKDIVQLYPFSYFQKSTCTKKTTHTFCKSSYSLNLLLFQLMSLLSS